MVAQPRRINIYFRENVFGLFFPQSLYFSILPPDYC